MAKILLLTDYSSGYSRNLLKGIVKYSKQFGPWVFYKMPLYYRKVHGEQGVVDWAKTWGADAIIAQLEDCVNVEQLKKLNIPIIVQNYRERSSEISNLTGDYFNAGVMAANFFLQRGFTNFAYYGIKDIIWSRERGEGFKFALQKHGFQVSFYEEKAKREEHWDYNPIELAKWLNTLPKPTALFACDDYFASQITETCNVSDINIPEEIAVLGVDDDQLICNISNPPLSSIVLDVENGGYRAARMLHQMLEGKITSIDDIIVSPIRVECRQSTEKYAVRNKYILDVLYYIEKHYMTPISVNDLMNLVPLSRRVLEKKFKEETGFPVYQYIQQFRIDKFCRYLTTTDMPLSEAALKSGFDDYKNLFRIFRKYKDMPPAIYRTLYQKHELVNE